MPGSPSAAGSTLGFRSITVSNVDTPQGAAWAEVRVGSVVLEMADDHRVLTLDDAQSQTLRLLLQDAVGHVDETILEDIRKQI
jgi:hypothetical protein